MEQPIAQYQRAFERIWYNLALDRFDVAKTDCLKLIKSLNALLKDNKGETVQSLSLQTLSLYNQIKNKTKLNNEDKIKWIASTLNGDFYPPIVHKKAVVEGTDFEEDLLPLSHQQYLSLNKWIRVTDQDWSTEGINSVYQDFLQDCSFVCSFISLSRNNSLELLKKVIHNNQSSFGVTLNFNGCERLVQVGNQLPELKDKSLFMKSKTNDNLYWPAIIEKAYLKVLGLGYESRGSNSNKDIFMLSGWIPEFRTSLEDGLWERLVLHFNRNEIVLGLGTGEFSKGFYPNHDYSVINIDKDSNKLIIKNPWLDDITNVKIEDVFEYFETLYINWNPKHFEYHSSLNFIWNNLSILKNSIYNNPQFSLKNRHKTIVQVWVLLEKHLGFEDSSINLIVYKNYEGERLFKPCEIISKSMANNTGFHLSKFELSPNESCTLVVFNDSNQPIQNFTVHSYSHKEVNLKKANSRYKYNKSLEGEWDVENCGGNWSNQSYLKNPTFKITVPDTARAVDIQIALSTEVSNQLVNSVIYWDDNDKPFSNKPVSSNQQRLYHPGSVLQQYTLEPGKSYQLICSTFETDILSKFKLLVSSDSQLEISKVFNRLGLFTKPFKFQWKDSNRFKIYINPQRDTEISIHLWSNSLQSSQYRPKLRASLFYSNGDPIKVNSEFKDDFYGIWIMKLKIKSGISTILLIERFEKGNDEVIGEIGSDSKISIE